MEPSSRTTYIIPAGCIIDVVGLITDGADDETRTRDPNLGKVVLYQLSYVRNGEPYWTRTSDTLIKSQVLYRLS